MHDETFTALYTELIQALYENPDISLRMRKLL